MKLPVTLALAAALLAPAGGLDAAAAERENPLLSPYNTPFDIPPYDRIQAADFLPAVRQGIAEHNAEIKAIATNKQKPTWENTIQAFEYSGQTLQRVLGVFYGLAEALATPEIQAAEAEISPLVSAHDDEMYMNDALFKRVKTLYDQADKLDLTVAQRRALDEYYKNFTRNGALLNKKQKAELSRINTALADRYMQFNRNLLAATNAFAIFVSEESRLSGLPASVIAQAAEKAQAAGQPGKWMFTLHAPSRLPVLTYANDRSLREQMYKGYTSLASSGEYNNYPVIDSILHLRAAKAKLLGFPNYAAYMTDNVMAKTPEAAEDLLMKLWVPARERVGQEVAEMQAIADRNGDYIVIAPWDYYYYAEKVRADKYNLSEEECSQYFAADSVRNGIFTMANRLYGLTFTEIPDAPKYHPDVKVYEVKDENGEHLAVFMTDYFPRDTKRQGAWMDAVVNSCVFPDGTVRRPIIYNVGNFAAPTADTPALLDIDNVETAFHEFGHALHGMLSRVALPGQAGTNVDRDLVEMFSQIHEHWKFEPALVKAYAHHWQTGEAIPDSLIQKLDAASTHNMGFMTAELSGAALLDLAYGLYNPAEGETVDIPAFEKAYADKIGMPEQLTFRYRSPYFKHIFGSDGYASGYYTYLWSAVLDSDGFELFRERGVFDPQAAAGLRHMMEMGGSEDPMTLFEQFRGHKPTPDALLHDRGLK